MDFYEYVKIATLGTKIYLCKEKEENLPKALAFMQKLYYLDITAKILCGLLILYFLKSYFDVHFEYSIF